jgi:hypothetical protein
MRSEYLLEFFRVFEGWLLLFPLSLFTFSLFLFAGPAPMWMAWAGLGIVVADLVLVFGFMIVFGGNSVIGMCSSVFQVCLFPFAVYYASDMVGPYSTKNLGLLIWVVMLGFVFGWMFTVQYIRRTKHEALLELSRLLGGDNVIVDNHFPSELKRPVLASAGAVISLMAAFAIGTIGRDPVASSHALFFVFAMGAMVLFVYGMIRFMTR